MSLLRKIKQKRELRSMADSFVEGIANEILRKKSLSLPLSKKQEKAVIKEARTELRRYAGSFISPSFQLNEEGIENLLKKHASTRERMPYYPSLIAVIRNLNPKSMLDLGCGLNPLAVANTEAVYYAFDIDEGIISLLNNFFKQKNIQGKAEVLDIRHAGSFPAADLCLILKVFDVIEKKGHKLAEEILKKLHCKKIIVSFSTKTLSGRPMRHPQRGWIERLSARLGYRFILMETKNELFYIIGK